MSEIDYAVRSIAEEVFDNKVGNLDDKIQDIVITEIDRADLGDQVSDELDYVLTEKMDALLEHRISNPDLLCALVEGLGTYLSGLRESCDSLVRGNNEKQKIIDDLQHQLNEIKERTDLLSVTNDAAPAPQQSPDRPF